MLAFCMSTITSFSDTFGAPTSNACASPSACCWSPLILSSDAFIALANVLAVAAPEPASAAVGLATPPDACAAIDCICCNTEPIPLTFAVMLSPKLRETRTHREIRRRRTTRAMPDSEKDSSAPRVKAAKVRGNPALFGRSECGPGHDNRIVSLSARSSERFQSSRSGETRRMDSQANSLINPDARAGLASPAPGAAAAAALPGVGGAGADFGLGGFAERIPGISRMKGNPKLPFLIAVAFAVAVITALVLWSRAPDYRVLYSNLSDRDGGAIIAALQQANVPYKFADAGGAILVPSNQVHETRLKLAAMGLPKGGSVGFELMDNQKFGISQFAEQINYQRALEGELQRTIESINAVRGARVHLAIPKPSVFVRDKEAPSASVFIDLYPGRVLDEGKKPSRGWCRPACPTCPRRT